MQIIHLARRISFFTNPWLNIFSKQTRLRCFWPWLLLRKHLVPATPQLDIDYTFHYYLHQTIFLVHRFPLRLVIIRDPFFLLGKRYGRDLEYHQNHLIPNLSFIRPLLILRRLASNNINNTYSIPTFLK